MKITFIPDVHVVADVGSWSPSNIKDEPMLHSSSIGFAYERGGPITKRVLDAVISVFNPAELQLDPPRYWVIDTRTVMLMPGQYPAIPGWHCDAVKRTAGQPDMSQFVPEVANYLVHISAAVDYDTLEPIAPTWYANEPISIDIASDDPHVWSTVHASCGRLARTTFMDGKIVRMTQGTLHTASPARVRCWRWWFRMSAYPRPPKPEVRQQVQVYCTEGGGW